MDPKDEGRAVPAGSNKKQESLETLQARLADGIDLALTIKQAHWNLKGPQYIGIHEMLDGFRDEMDQYNDKVAERITELGGTARGIGQAAAKGADPKPYPLDTYATADHLAALIDRYAVYASAVRKNIDDIDEAGDADTSILFAEVARGVDKSLWFLEAHAQDPSGMKLEGVIPGELKKRAVDVFGSKDEATEWFNNPAIGLDQQSPKEVLDQKGGAEKVSKLLDRIDRGTYT